MVEYDSLDSLILGMTKEPKEEDITTRKTASFSNESEKFIVKKRTYKEQYAQLYFVRLLQMSPWLKAAIEVKFPDIPAVKILDLEEGVDCVVVGVLYKDMTLKPTILDEYVKEGCSKSDANVSKFVSDTDFLELEDEGSRMRLQGAHLDAANFLTGIVVAVRGTTRADGVFNVQEVIYPHYSEPHHQQAPLPAPAQIAPKDKRYIVFASGLDFGGPTDPMPAQLLFDYVCGFLGSNQAAAGAIVRLVLVGDSVLPTETPAGKLNKQQQREVTAPLKEFDIMLKQLAGGVPVDVMPGPSDFSNHSLPQQPMHPCLFPEASAFSTFSQVTNPYSFNLNSCRYLGTSGQNIMDMDKYSDMEDRLDIMEASLKWRHIAPTAPDTLATYPFHDHDPFVIDVCPQVYFAGNQPGYGTRLVETPSSSGTLETRLLTIPRFSETGVAVLLDIDTLTSQPIQFSANLTKD